MNKLIAVFLIISLIGISHAAPYDMPQEPSIINKTIIKIEDKANDILIRYSPESNIVNYSKVNFEQKCTYNDKEFYQDNIVGKGVVEVKLTEESSNINNNLDEEAPKKKGKNGAQKGVKESWKIKYLNNFTLPDDIEIYDKDNKEHYLDEFENKTLLIVFWATWSSPCLQDLIALDDLKKDFRKLPFEIIPVSVDYQDSKIVFDFLVKNNIRHLKAYHDRRNRLFKAFSVIGLPTAFLITPEGEAIASIQGVVNWYDDSIREMLFSYMKTENSLPKNSYHDKSLNYSVRSIDNKEKKTNTIEKKTLENNLSEKPKVESRDKKEVNDKNDDNNKYKKESK
ncbi:MAG: tlpA [Rickettsiaceae bacterium]|jgi:thiol-disulfide isomerase/thioredoxin|nr:tlpA [Rickettsiaceae bacterium]